MSAAAEYARRLEAARQTAAREEQRSRQFGNVRLALAVIGLVSAWRVFGAAQDSPWQLAVVTILFLALVLLHHRTDQRRRRALRLARYYELGLARVEDRWMGLGISGEQFRPAHHLYADDLDLFGQGSVFELLCTARTTSGQETLARWLTTPASSDEALARQAAVGELRPRLDLREDFAMLGLEVAAGLHPAALIAWAKQPPLRFPRRLALIAAAVCLLTAGMLAFVLQRGLPLSFAFPFLLLQMGLALWVRPLVLRVIADVEQPSHDLLLLSQVLKRIEAEQFRSPLLAQLRETLNNAGHPPSRAVARLRQLISLLDSRRNAFFALPAALLLWGTQFSLAIERWRCRHGEAVEHWLAAVGEVEALCGLAAYAYERPSDPFPVFVDGPCYEAEELAHPLLPEARAIRNTVRLCHEQRLLVVSGSNMSGKSTLLRAVGVNAVLAYAGAPVRAKALRLSPLTLGASIRIQDSLQAGASRFYAEISRLRDIVEQSRGTVPVLFLLDELLSGTNSHDRRLGAEAVVQDLVQRGHLGLVTTHDLALTRIVDAVAPLGENVHFEDRLIDGKLVFDYRMRAGVVEHSNALALMRSIGLEV